MRKLGVRVASAALAACMMASVLPVGAFAAGNGNDYDDGVSTYAAEESEAAKQLPRNGNINVGGTYEMSGTYTKGFVIGIDSTAANRDVTIKITGDVNFQPSGSEFYLFRVTGVKTLTIENDGGYTVDAGSKTFIVVQYSSDLETLTINGGTYKSSTTVFQVMSNETVRPHVNTTLNGVTMESTGGSALINQGTGTLTINGGSYSNASASNAALSTDAGTMIVEKGAVVKNTAGTAVNNHAGTVELKGGTYTSEGNTVYTGASAKTTVEGGTFTRTGVKTAGSSNNCEVFTNFGTLTIEDGTINPSKGNLGAVINRGTLDFNGGTINATTGAGIQTVGDTGETPKTTVSGGSITGSNGGVSLQAGTLDVTLKSGVLSGNANDIVLREDQMFKIDADYDTGSAPVSVRVFDPNEGRAITPAGMPSGVKFISHNGSEWTIEYAADGHYYLHKNFKYGLTVQNAEAQLDEGTDDDGNSNRTPLDVTVKNQIAKGARVELKANDAPFSDEGKEQVFDKWVVEKSDGTLIDDLTGILDETGSEKATLTMPDYDVIVTATYKEKPETPEQPGDIPEIPDAGNDSGSDSAGIVGAIVAGGAVIWGAYEAGTGIYRLVHMPGIILPSNRAELALLIWEQADKPAPESEELYADIDEDDTDLQQAARWMAEQELMKDDEDNNKFVPGAPVTKLQVCLTWQKAEDKGLID